MITRLEVDGFKSLRDFAIDLDPFTVLIGPNSAGKSNILEALALLSRLASDPIAEAFKNGRGRPSDQFTRHGSETAQSIRFAVESLSYGHYSLGQGPTPNDPSRCRYELKIERQTLANGTERLLARDERFRVLRQQDDHWIKSHPEFADRVSYRREGEDVFTSLRNPSAEQRIIGLPNSYPEELRVPPSHTALSRVNYIGVTDLRDDLINCLSLQLGTAALGEPSERIYSGEFAGDASNLPTVLAGLPPASVGEIQADLVTLVPGIAGFHVVPDGDDIRIDFEISGGDRMPARLVSDGTLRILALLTALRLEPRPHLIYIEEPENGIYPGRLRALLDLLQKETARRHDEAEDLARLDAKIRAARGGAMGMPSNLLPTQIIATTHSPVFLAALRTQPQQLRFVDTVRRDGHRVTRVRTVGRSNATNRDRTTISAREIDLLLHAAQGEASE